MKLLFFGIIDLEMGRKSMDIKKTTALTNAHYELLLLADPSEKLVKDYIKRSFVFEIKKERLLGIIVLLPKGFATIEILNIAVAPAFQGQGIGQKLLNFALTFAKKEHYQTIEIGTGSTSVAQLYLYQKCGFRMHAIDKDFFVKNYPQEIIENGLVLKDRIRLRIDL